MTDEEILTRDQQDEKLVNDAFQELLERYLETKHRKKIEIITKAFRFAKQAHKGIRRKSGEPYILHPIAVARIACCEIGLGSTSICAALLHDVVEDTDYTVEDIQNLFGDKIAQIVEGLTKISSGMFTGQTSAQAENLKKLLLTMNEDIRVILIKIADRLHNMRTLGSMAANKQYKIAGETLYIYAPLANRLGLNRIKTELEDLSFAYEHPEQYKEIQEKLASTQVDRDNLFSEFTEPVRKMLDQMGFQYHLLARIKSPYSIWQKMQKKHINFDEVYDLLAVRIIFKPRTPDSEESDCFAIYLGLSRLYKEHPERLRNWISQPKANGYRALHVTLMSGKGRWVEVQIRSEKMDDLAEQGFAAHWKYKEGAVGEEESELTKWLKTIKEILADPQPSAMDFLDTIKMNLYSSEIIVFTPKGEIITMPQNCTALDFAFSIHTFLGSHCIGAKVNHKLVSMSHKLQGGDQVEILTSNSQKVQPSWLDIATTAKAKAKIDSILRKERREYIQKGEDTLRTFLKEAGYELTDAHLRTLTTAHGLSNSDEFLLQIGRGIVTLIQADIDTLAPKRKGNTGWKKFIPFNLAGNSNTMKPIVPPAPVVRDIDKKKVFKVTPEDKASYIIADCCKPIPGDDVLGYIDNDNRIIIHKRQCSIATQLKNSFGDRLLAVEWETGRAMDFPVYLYIKGLDNIGMLNKVTQVISADHNMNMQRMNIIVNDGIFEGRIQALVHDVKDVAQLSRHLKEIPGLTQVVRLESFEEVFNG